MNHTWLHAARKEQDMVTLDMGIGLTEVAKRVGSSWIPVAFK